MTGKIRPVRPPLEGDPPSGPTFSLPFGQPLPANWREGSRDEGSAKLFVLVPDEKSFYVLRMQAHRAETTLAEDGIVTIRDTPFRRGESVEVIVFPFSPAADPAASDPLHGIPMTFLPPPEPLGVAKTPKELLEVFRRLQQTVGLTQADASAWKQTVAEARR